MVDVDEDIADEDEDIVDDEVDALKPAFLRLLMMRLSL